MREVLFWGESREGMHTMIEHEGDAVYMRWRHDPKLPIYIVFRARSLHTASTFSRPTGCLASTLQNSR